MSWLWLAGATLVGIVAGFFIGWRTAVSAVQPAIQQLNRDLATDRNFVLRVLRRELANWMLRRDPDRYLRIYKKAHEATAAISGADRSGQRSQLGKLTEQYKFYTDFDFINTRDYVLYSDALSNFNSYDEVERHYTDIIRFQALQIATNENWSEIYPMPHPTSEAELAHLETYVQRFKDARFKNRLRHAIEEFRLYQTKKTLDPFYETPVLSVCSCP